MASAKNRGKGDHIVVQVVAPGQVSDEAILVERARSRDRAALQAIYDRYAERVYAYVYRRVGDRETAEDLTGEVFARMLKAQRRGQFARTSLAAWLYRIAHNLVIDHYRSHPAPALPLEEEIEAGDGPPALFERKQAGERLRAALRQISAEQQQVIVLRFGEGLTAREVAQALEKPEGAVRSLQHRALVALRRLLEGERG